MSRTNKSNVNVVIIISENVNIDKQIVGNITNKSHVANDSSKKKKSVSRELLCNICKIIAKIVSLIIAIIPLL